MWKMKGYTSSNKVSRHVSRLETVARHRCLGLGSVSTLIYLVLAYVSSIRVSSCLVSLDCVCVRRW